MIGTSLSESSRQCSIFSHIAASFRVVENLCAIAASSLSRVPHAKRGEKGDRIVNGYASVKGEFSYSDGTTYAISLLAREHVLLQFDLLLGT